MSRTPAKNFFDELFKWVILGLIILLVYEIYKQFKAGVTNIGSAISAAIASVASDVQGIVSTLFTNPLAFLTDLPNLIIGFIGNIFSGLFSNPLGLILSLPSMAFSFLESLFGGTNSSILPATPAINQSNTFTGNGVVPGAPTATSSLPSWLTTSPTAALPSIANPFSDVNSVVPSTQTLFGGASDGTQQGFSASLSDLGSGWGL